MPGLAEILDENSRLREQNRVYETRLQEQEERLEAFSDQERRLREQEAQLATLREMVEQLKERNERFEKLAEFEEKKRQLAKAERFIAAENQAELFERCEVTVPPRDPTVEAATSDEPEAASTNQGRLVPPRHQGTDLGPETEGVKPNAAKWRARYGPRDSA